jgi:hypothetical protein
MPGMPAGSDTMAAQSAIAGLDEDRSKLYYDLVMRSLSTIARKALQTMDLDTYEYQSNFARRFHKRGVRDGRKAMVIMQLGLRFGPLTPETEKRINATCSDELDGIAQRLLTAPTLHEALGCESADI